MRLHPHRHLPIATVVRFALALSIVALAAARTSAAEVVELVIASPPSPVGAGARATGLGSAFIALADDATAASWNPAGLVQLERPEVSVVSRGILQVDEVGTLRGTEMEPQGANEIERHVGTDRAADAALNYASAAIPFSWNQRNIVVSINYQQMLAFDRHFSYTGSSTSAGSSTIVETDRTFDQDGHVDAISPALAFELSPGWSLGAALNIWFDGLGRSAAWQHTFRTQRQFLRGDDTTSESTSFDRVTFSDFRGTNATFGVLGDLGHGLSVGAVADLSFHATFERDTYLTSSTTEIVQRSHQSLAMELPFSYGFGLAWRPYDALVLSTDVTRVDWGSFHYSDGIDDQFLFTGDRAGTAHVDAVTTLRIGGEHTWRRGGSSIAARAGAFYDPQPSRGSPADFFGGGVGGGWATDAFSFDVGYQLRVGLNVSDRLAVTEILDVPDGKIDVFQHQLYGSLVVYL